MIPTQNVILEDQKKVDAALAEFKTKTYAELKKELEILRVEIFQLKMPDHQRKKELPIKQKILDELEKLLEERLKKLYGTTLQNNNKLQIGNAGLLYLACADLPISENTFHQQLNSGIAKISKQNNGHSNIEDHLKPNRVLAVSNSINKLNLVEIEKAFFSKGPYDGVIKDICNAMSNHLNNSINRFSFAQATNTQNRLRTLMDSLNIPAQDKTSLLAPLRPIQYRDLISAIIKQAEKMLGQGVSESTLNQLRATLQMCQALGIEIDKSINTKAINSLTKYGYLGKIQLDAKIAKEVTDAITNNKPESIAKMLKNYGFISITPTTKPEPDYTKFAEAIKQDFYYSLINDPTLREIIRKNMVGKDLHSAPGSVSIFKKLGGTTSSTQILIEDLNKAFNNYKTSKDPNTESEKQVRDILGKLGVSVNAQETIISAYKEKTSVRLMPPTRPAPTPPKDINKYINTMQNKSAPTRPQEEPGDGEFLESISKETASTPPEKELNIDDFIDKTKPSTEVISSPKKPEVLTIHGPASMLASALPKRTGPTPPPKPQGFILDKRHFPPQSAKPPRPPKRQKVVKDLLAYGGEKPKSPTPA